MKKLPSLLLCHRYHETEPEWASMLHGLRPTTCLTRSRLPPCETNLRAACLNSCNCPVASTTIRQIILTNGSDMTSVETHWLIFRRSHETHMARTLFDSLLTKDARFTWPTIIVIISTCFADCHTGKRRGHIQAVGSGSSWSRWTAKHSEWKSSGQAASRDAAALERWCLHSTDSPISSTNHIARPFKLATMAKSRSNLA